MYVILNQMDNSVQHFTTVKKAVKYTKALRGDQSEPTKEEIRDMCNTFSKYKNKIAINGLRK